jgi:hypothetical protein
MRRITTPGAAPVSFRSRTEVPGDLSHHTRGRVSGRPTIRIQSWQLACSTFGERRAAPGPRHRKPAPMLHYRPAGIWFLQAAVTNDGR